MNESKLVTFPNRLKEVENSPKNNKKSVSYGKMNSLFIEKSAEEFINSILKGDLYEELRPKGKKIDSNITHF